MSSPAALEILTWLDENGIKILNVAGARESKDPKIYSGVKDVLTGVFVVGVQAGINSLPHSNSTNPTAARNSRSLRQSMRPLTV